MTDLKSSITWPVQHLAFMEAVALIEEHAYWEAHEVLEGIWAPLEECGQRSVLKALIQFCAAAHKPKQCRLGKPEASMQRGMHKLCQSATGYLNAIELCDAPQLREPVHALSAALKRLEAVPEHWREQGLDTAQCETHAIALELAHRLSSSYLEATHFIIY